MQWEAVTTRSNEILNKYCTTTPFIIEWVTPVLYLNRIFWHVFIKRGANVKITPRQNVFLLIEYLVSTIYANFIIKVLFLAAVHIDRSQVSLILKFQPWCQFQVNNSGLFNPSSFSESTLELFDHLFSVNVRFSNRLDSIGRCLTLIKTKGNIVNMIFLILVAKGSDFGNVLVQADQSNFGSLYEVPLLDLGPKGVRVNSVK